MQAVVEVPGQARIEALSQSEIEPLEDGDSALEMRVGKVRTTVLSNAFELRTPVVRIKGVRGALFDTRVVLDASTTVEVLRGLVEVHSLRVAGKRWIIGKGKRGHFDTAGGGSIKKIVDKDA